MIRIEKLGQIAAGVGAAGAIGSGISLNSFGNKFIEAHPEAAKVGLYNYAVENDLLDRSAPISEWGSEEWANLSAESFAMSIAFIFIGAGVAFLGTLRK